MTVRTATADATIASVYAAMVTDRLHFAQASYRDGEWACMLGLSGRNVNGEAYNPELGARLRATLLQPNGQWCIFWPAVDVGAKLRKRAAEWIAQHKPQVRWIADRPLGRANEEGEIAPFFRACHSRHVVLVGPPHLAQLPESLIGEPRLRFEVPNDGTAWQHADELALELKQYLRPDDLVLFAAGMASNLLIHELWGEPKLKGALTLIDVGAILDPYCGVYSRSLFRTPGWQRYKMPRNLPGGP